MSMGPFDPSFMVWFRTMENESMDPHCKSQGRRGKLGLNYKQQFRSALPMQTWSGIFPVPGLKVWMGRILQYIDDFVVFFCQVESSTKPLSLDVMKIRSAWRSQSRRWTTTRWVLCVTGWGSFGVDELWNLDNPSVAALQLNKAEFFY